MVAPPPVLSDRGRPAQPGRRRHAAPGCRPRRTRARGRCRTKVRVPLARPGSARGVPGREVAAAAAGCPGPRRHRELHHSLRDHSLSPACRASPATSHRHHRWPPGMPAARPHRHGSMARATKSPRHRRAAGLCISRQAGRVYSAAFISVPTSGAVPIDSSRWSRPQAIARSRFITAPVPAGISRPTITFSFNPIRLSVLPATAASVSTLVVSWKDAAEMKLLVCRLGPW